MCIQGSPFIGFRPVSKVRFLLVVMALAVALLLFLVVKVRSQVSTCQGVEQGYCQQVLARVEAVAACKADGGPITVEVIPEVSKSGLMCLGDGIKGLYEQDRRHITVVRESLCPWLLAHEFAHAIYCDHYSFHPERWADLTADMAVGGRPGWAEKEEE